MKRSRSPGDELEEVYKRVYDNPNNAWEYECKHCHDVKKILSKHVADDIAELIADYGKDFVLLQDNNWGDHSLYRVWDLQCSLHTQGLELKTHNYHQGLLSYPYILNRNIKVMANWFHEPTGGRTITYESKEDSFAALCSYTNMLVRSGRVFNIRGGYIQIVKEEGVWNFYVYDS